MRKLNKAIDRFCALHPRFGIPGLMSYIVGANLVIYLLSQFAGAGTLDFLGYGNSCGASWRNLARFTYVLIPSYSGIALFFFLLVLFLAGRDYGTQWGSAKFTSITSAVRCLLRLRFCWPG